MKTIQLKSEKEIFVINGKEQEVAITTIELLRTSINSPVQGGYSLSDLKLRLKLIDLVDKTEKEGKSTIDFEDTDFSELSKIVKASKWSIISKTILNFVEDFS